MEKKVISAAAVDLAESCETVPFRVSTAAALRSLLVTDVPVCREEVANTIIKNVRASARQKKFIIQECRALDSLLGYSNAKVAITDCLSLFRLLGVSTEGILSEAYIK